MVDQTVNPQADEVDSTAQVEKKAAGFASVANDVGPEEDASAVVPAASDEQQKWINTLLTDADAHTAIPLIEPEAGDRIEPTVNFEIFDLHTELCKTWGQDLIDLPSFDKIKDFKVVQESSDATSLVLYNETTHDEIEVGVTPDHRHVVAGADNITAEQALSRALVAMTSDVIRANGVTVFGTEKDQALLLLAAQEAGLTVIDAPTDIPEAVLAEAQAEWDALLAARAAAPEVVAEEVATEEVVAEATEELAPANTAAAVTEEPEPSLQDLAQGIEVVELPVAATAAPEETTEQTTAAASEATAEVEAESPVPATTTDEPTAATDAVAPAGLAEDDGIPVLIDVVEPGLPKNVVDLLRTADVSAAQYIKAREFVTARHEKVVDGNGIVKPTTLAKPFWESGVGPKKASAMLKAMEAEGLVQSTGRTKAEYSVPAPQPAGL